MSGRNRWHGRPVDGERLKRVKCRCGGHSANDGSKSRRAKALSERRRIRPVILRGPLEYRSSAFWVSTLAPMIVIVSTDGGK